LPASQNWPPKHWPPHALQLFGSLIVFTQVVGLLVGHAVSPGQVKPQAPASQAATPPDGVLQGAQALPQFSVLAGHWQFPASQNPPVEHAWVHPPQFVLSVVVFTHALPQRVRDGALLHVPTQVVP
jgi:hypothetical protein